jgi:uncharacterized protein (TIGR02265 family)
VSGVSVDFARVAVDLGLDRRLRDAPASACVRGVFFNMVRDDLIRRRLLGLPEARALFKDPRKSYQLYSLREILEGCAYAGALVNADPSEGIRQLFVGTAGYYSSTWYGAAFARFLKPDPAAALGWIERSREHMANYGKWRLERRGRERAILHMFDEYLWIESIHRGGCEGMLLSCGVTGEVRVHRDDDYNGRLDIRWQLHN